MKKLFITATLLIYIGSGAICQKAIGTVNYLQNFSNESYEKIATLHFNSQHSLYYYDRSEDGNNHKEIIEDEANLHTIIKITDGEGRSFYKNKSNNTLTSRVNIFTKHYIVEEGLPKMKWVLHKDTKMIGTYKCKKATTHFRGRDFIAWFSPDIPVSTGPWKFHGLPGLILEAYDVDKLFTFHFLSLKYDESIDSSIITSPTKGKKTSWNGYVSQHKKTAEAFSNMLKSNVDPLSTSNIEVTVNLDLIEKLIIE